MYAQQQVQQQAHPNHHPLIQQMQGILATLAQLLPLLQEQKQLLAKRETPRLTLVLDAQKPLLLQLLQQEKQLVAQLGGQIQHQRLITLINTLPGGLQVQGHTLASALLQQLENLQALTLVNAQMLARSQLNNRKLLAILRGGQSSATTYHRNGKAASNLGGRTLAQA